MPSGVRDALPLLVLDLLVLSGFVILALFLGLVVKTTWSRYWRL